MPVSKNQEWVKKNDGVSNGKEKNQVEKKKKRMIRPSHETRNQTREEAIGRAGAGYAGG